MERTSRRSAIVNRRSFARRILNRYGDSRSASDQLHRAQSPFAPSSPHTQKSSSFLSSHCSPAVELSCSSRLISRILSGALELEIVSPGATQPTLPLFASLTQESSRIPAASAMISSSLLKIDHERKIGSQACCSSHKISGCFSSGSGSRVSTEQLQTLRSRSRTKLMAPAFVHTLAVSPCVHNALGTFQ